MTDSSAPRVTVLISGRGSNLRALLEHQGNYRITGVISNKPDAGGLDHAREFGVPHTVVTRDSFSDLAYYKAAVLEATQATRPDIVTLAGFMMIVQPEFVSAFEGRFINIHPSLLPKYPGLQTHERALEANDPLHGCTVHFVDTGVDSGPLIAQAAVRVDSADTPATLAARVVTKEHLLYPWCLAAMARGEISLVGRTVWCSPAVSAEAHERGFTIFNQ